MAVSVGAEIKIAELNERKDYMYRNLTIIFIIALTLIIFILAVPMTNTSEKGAPINIKKGMNYIKARNILLKDGWQTVVAHTWPNGTPLCFKATELHPGDKEYDEVYKTPACSYEEIESCSGTGMGFCEMSFFDGDKTYLKIQTAEGEPPAAIIYRWRKQVGEDSENSPKNNGEPGLTGERLTPSQAKKILLAQMATDSKYQSLDEAGRAAFDCVIDLFITDTFKGKSSIIMDDMDLKMKRWLDDAANLSDDLKLSVMGCVVGAVDNVLTDLDAVKVDGNTLIGKKVEVKVLGNYLMNSFMIKKTPNDTSPVLVDISKLTRDDKMKIVQLCSDITTGCSMTVSGTVGKVSYQTGVIASKIQW